MIDARGYLCPMPVVMVQKEVKMHAPAALDVLVDNRTAVENLTRFAEHNGYRLSVEPQGMDFLLRMTK